MRFADRIIDLGPGAGAQGGRIVAEGSWKALAKNGESPTGKILGQPLRHPLLGKRRAAKDAPGWCTVTGAHANNLKDLDVKFPAGRFIALCGVSGAGKSTLLHDVIKPAAAAFAGRKGKRGKAPQGPWKKVEGFERFTSVYEVDQAPIGKTSRSTPATYIGLMDEIRGLFARAAAGAPARLRGLALFLQQRQRPLPRLPGPGRGEGGDGVFAVDLRAVRDVPRPALRARDARGVVQRQVDRRRARPHYRAGGRFLRRRAAVAPAAGAAAHTGLGYLTLGQRSPTLSGGEAQRIKLVAELARSLEMNAQKRLKTRGFGSLHHLYLLEEPTIGLHLADVQRLLQVLHQLVDAGHTVMVIEHHLDVLADADHLIELGPEGGDGGGRLIAQGTPEEVARTKRSITAPFLKPMLRRD